MMAINEIPNIWFASSDEVVRFGRDLLHNGRFASEERGGEADNLLNYFDKPHHWNQEHAWWVANDWPDDAESWERGHDTAWEIT